MAGSVRKGNVVLKSEFRSLAQLIKTNEYPGDFFCSGVLPIIPDIQFKETQTYLDPSFPKPSKSASDRTPISIKDLIDLCTQAPFGRDEETVVDETVRSCWQLETDEFTIRWSKQWENALLNLKCSARGVLAPVLPGYETELRPYKLLVYEKGSHFLPHRDTQRSEYHFGTVVISLPVKHTGGDLHVRHMGEEQIHKTESTSSRTSKQCQWAAFFTDVEHEIKEVTSGHRIALVYHLYRTFRTGNITIKPPVPNSEHPIVKSLKEIQEHLVKIDNGEVEGQEDLVVDQYSHAGYILEHKYTPSSLKPKNLKGRDAFLYQLLLESGLDLRLVALEVRVDAWGYNDYGKSDLSNLISKDVEFSEMDVSSPVTVTSGGKKTKVFPSRLMTEVSWLIEDIAKHVESLRRVDKHIRGTGNEGCDWHSTYLTSAFVINLMPGKEITRFKFSVGHTNRPYPYYGP